MQFHKHLPTEKKGSMFFGSGSPIGIWPGSKVLCGEPQCYMSRNFPSNVGCILYSDPGAIWKIHKCPIPPLCSILFPYMDLVPGALSYLKMSFQSYDEIGKCQCQVYLIFKSITWWSLVQNYHKLLSDRLNICALLIVHIT